MKIATFQPHNKTLSQLVFLLLIAFVVLCVITIHHYVGKYLQNNRIFTGALTQIPPPVKVLNPDRVKIIQWMDIMKHGFVSTIEKTNFNECEQGAQNCRGISYYQVNDTERVYGPLSADAVVFHGIHTKNFRRPLRRDPSQVFVFAERENWQPAATYAQMESGKYRHMGEFKDAFNWTMTYTLDSDIHIPYGEVKKQKLYESNKNFDAIYDKKKYSVAWAVSHCRTPSRREDYVKEMQKYIDVHIYGGCGTYSCPRKAEYRTADEMNCTYRIATEYKFYLSFENTYQRNYVTEKLFNWFPSNIVQVVRGGGGNYSTYGVPDGSVIDADQFPSAKELANYLLEVGSSRQKYIKHLKRKDGYYTISKRDMVKRGYCQLCKMLQDVNKYRKMYNHIGAWWQYDAANLKPAYVKL